MVEIINGKVKLARGMVYGDNAEVINKRLAQLGEQPVNAEQFEDADRNGTITYKILNKHKVDSGADGLKLRFDALASHDITYVGILQTARASGLEKFPVPYVLTNCHNSLCAVGGTINEDDHLFGYSAAQKYGGIFVPAHMAVIHQYMREMMTGCGKMILGSDSHTRYGALGTMGIGEGGPELVKQLLGRTYDVAYPEVIAVYLEGEPQAGVGPQDVALAFIGEVFSSGFVKNKVVEFVGPGIEGLSVDYRNGIDVMTTEATCLSSIWRTDEKVRQYYKTHGREGDYSPLEPEAVAQYDGMVRIDLSKVEPQIAMPFHPSNVYSIREFKQNTQDILLDVERRAAETLGAGARFSLARNFADGKFRVDQAVIAGCSGGTYENLAIAADMLDGYGVGGTAMGVSAYPASQPVFLDLSRRGYIDKLTVAGVSLRSAFCGPCFGAGDVPYNNGFSIRHTTRNFPNREGSKPADGQVASVALMDARSIAATVRCGGVLTAATEIELADKEYGYEFDRKVYDNRVYFGYGQPKDVELKFGPNIREWPLMSGLKENLLLKAAAVIDDEVTTTDELIPSGEASSYRSNPYKLAEFTLSRKDPAYVGRAKAIAAAAGLPEVIEEIVGKDWEENTSFGSVVVANKPGDGSAREQAASCQKVLGGWANIAVDYATKRYRSNLINWGMVPFVVSAEDKGKINIDDYIFIEDIKEKLEDGNEEFKAIVIRPSGEKQDVTLYTPKLTADEKDIILAGSLINYYRMG